MGRTSGCGPSAGEGGRPIFRSPSAGVTWKPQLISNQAGRLSACGWQPRMRAPGAPSRRRTGRGAPSSESEDRPWGLGASEGTRSRGARRCRAGHSPAQKAPGAASEEPSTKGRREAGGRRAGVGAGAGRPAGLWGRGGAAPSQDPDRTAASGRGAAGSGWEAPWRGRGTHLSFFRGGGTGARARQLFFYSYLFIIIIRTLNFNISRILILTYTLLLIFEPGDCIHYQT